MSLRTIFAFAVAVFIFLAIGLIVIVVDHNETAAAQSVCRQHGEVVLQPGGDWRCVRVVEAR